MPVQEFASLINQPIEQVGELLDGRTPITIGLALTLHTVLGGSAEFWVARDFQYREDSKPKSAEEDAWLSQLPVADMVRFGWLRPAPRPFELLSACLSFFDVPNVRAWHDRYRKAEGLAVFRASPSFESHPASVVAWLRQGEIVAGKSNCEQWNAKLFQDRLLDIRGLSLHKDPARFLPLLQDACRGFGVAVVAVRAPGGCPACGATRFLSSDKALLLLSFRHLTDDQFWFSFFHEAGHLLLHGTGGLVFEGMDNASDAMEREANDFAERMLFPGELRAALRDLPPQQKAIVRFARDAGISPGIVVGQLQHYGKIPRNFFNGLKRRYEWR